MAALALCATLAACSSSGSSTAEPSARSAVTLPASEVMSLKSSSTGRSYDLYIGYPEGYSRAGSTRYPVLYLLDGQWDFKLVQAIYDDQLYDRQVPEMLIVAITYSGKDPDYGALRARDYTPVQSPEEPGSGDGPRFLQFLRTELIPFVESTLPADPGRRVLMGSSYGGLFTLYSLFTDPKLFKGYVAASPAVWFARSQILRQEAAYAAKRHDLPARLWIAVGSAEQLSAPVQSFWQVMTSRGYAGLELQTRLIEGEGHAGSKPEAYSRGLRYVFGGI